MELYIPTRLIMGAGCILENAHLFASFGKKAFIVTGKNSAEKSGALKDVVAALKQCDIRFEIFNEVENNPSLETCYRGGKQAKEYGAEFVVAIGGGSPMDAAKAIAAYANNKIEPKEIYDKLENPPLDIISVPLTAGTGSEVTPYSVLTVHEIENKLTFSHPGNFSKIAFLDPNYLKTMSRATLLDTVADALSHAVESILCKRNTLASSVHAESALRLLSKCIPQIVNEKPDYEKLLLASSLAGMAIAHTGTVIVHSMGYLLTYYKGVPHGRANALLLPGFVKLCAKHVPDRLETVLNAFNAKDAEDFCQTVKLLTAEKTTLSADEATSFAAKAFLAKNVAQNLWPLTQAEEENIFKELMN